MYHEANQEEYWMNALQKGDEKALTHFFDLHYKALCYFTKQMTLDQHASEDIVAEVFVKFWNRHTDFETTTNIKAFLYISCRNACLDFLKIAKRKTAAQERYFNQLTKEDDTVLEQIIEAEFLQELNVEIEKLPEKCKQIFKMIYFEGLKTDEIALRLDLSVKTVRNQKARAVELLKKTFLDKGLLPVLYVFLQFLISKK